MTLARSVAEGNDGVNHHVVVVSALLRQPGPRRVDRPFDQRRVHARAQVSTLVCPRVNTGSHRGGSPRSFWDIVGDWHREGTPDRYHQRAPLLRSDPCVAQGLTGTFDMITTGASPSRSRDRSRCQSRGVLMQERETCPLTIRLASGPRHKTLPDLMSTNVEVMGVHSNSLAVGKRGWRLARSAAGEGTHVSAVTPCRPHRGR